MEINKLTILVIIGAYLAICPVLFAQDNLYPFLVKHTAVGDESNHNIDLSYCNLYRKNSTGEPDGLADVIAYKLGYSLKAGKHIYDVGYYKYCFRAEVKALSGEDDRIGFIVQNESITLGTRWQLKQNIISGKIALGSNPGFFLDYTYAGNTQYHMGLGFAKGSADIDYDVNGADGSIPFRWHNISTDCSLQKADDFIRLNYRSVVPAKADGKFNNKLYQNEVAMELSKHIRSNMSLKGNADYTYSFADLNYNHEQYSKLDNLHILYANLYLRHSSTKDISLDTGTKAFISRIGADSYFDIWPFTYWDLFLAHRTRLKKADINSMIPYICINYDKVMNKEDNPLRLKASLEYDHLFHNADIIVKNRRVVMYPFLFTYDTDYYDLGSDVDGFFILPVTISYQRWGIETGISFEQMIPVDWKSLTHHSTSHTPSDGNKSKESGGTRIRFYLSLPTPDLTK